MHQSSLLNVNFVIESMQEGNYLALNKSDALKRHLQSKAHSLPAELTNIVAAASRQTGFTDSANFL